MSGEWEHVHHGYVWVHVWRGGMEMERDEGQQKLKEQKPATSYNIALQLVIDS